MVILKTNVDASLLEILFLLSFFPLYLYIMYWFNKKTKVLDNIEFVSNEEIFQEKLKEKEINKKIEPNFLQRFEQEQIIKRERKKQIEKEEENKLAEINSRKEKEKEEKIKKEIETLRSLRLNDKIFVEETGNAELTKIIQKLQSRYGSEIKYNPIKNIWSFPSLCMEELQQFKVIKQLEQKQIVVSKPVSICLIDIIEDSASNEHFKVTLPEIHSRIFDVLKDRFFSKRNSQYSIVHKIYGIELVNYLRTSFMYVELSNRAQKLYDLLIEKRQIELEKLDEAKRDIKLDLNNFRGKLFPFQEDALKQMLVIKNPYLGYEQGTGKTVITIAYLSELNKKALIIVPSAIKENWANEIVRFSGNQFTIELAKGWKYEFQESDIIIINYDIIWKHRNKLRELVKDRVLICDEAQRSKNAPIAANPYGGKPTGCKTTRAIHDIAANAKEVIFLSGTPILNKPSDIWYQLVGLGHAYKISPNLNMFRKEFSVGVMAKHGYWEKAGKNLDRLHERIRPFFLRCKAKDVLKDLPSETVKLLEFELASPYLKEYKKAEQDFIKYLVDKDKVDAAQRAKKAEHLVKLTELRRVSALGKVKQCIELIQDLQDNDRRVIVFCHHREPLIQLNKHFKKNSGLLIGGSGTKDLNRFTNGSIDHLFISGQCGGVGLNLVQASIAIFLDQPWTAGEKLQEMTRIFRHGQKLPVTYFNLIGKNTIDFYQCAKIDSRAKDLKDLCGDKNKEMVFGEDIRNELVQHLLVKNGYQNKSILPIKENKMLVNSNLETLFNFD